MTVYVILLRYPDDFIELYVASTCQKADSLVSDLRSLRLGKISVHSVDVDAVKKMPKLKKK